MANWELATPIALAKQRRVRAPWYLDLSPVTLSFSVIGIVMLTSMLYLTQASRVAAIGYDIKSLQATRAKLQREREQLQLQATQLQSLARIEGQAISRLGMAHAYEEQFTSGLAPPVDMEEAVRRAENTPADPRLPWRERLVAAIRGAPTALAHAARSQPLGVKAAVHKGASAPAQPR